jgi:transcriptional regulator with XRE-family HTH domain
VRILREEKDLTQAELAERAGIGAKYIGEVERGRTNPTMRLVWRLGGALEAEVFELFLFSLMDGEPDGKARIQLMHILKKSKGKELERVMQILNLLILEQEGG